MVTQETCFQVHSPLGIALEFVSKLYASDTPPKFPDMVIMIFPLPKNLQVFPDNKGMWTGVMRRSQKGLHRGKGVYVADKGFLHLSNARTGLSLSE